MKKSITIATALLMDWLASLGEVTLSTLIGNWKTG
jgi:hypothetical protein